MKKLERLLSGMLAAVLMLSLSACGQKADPQPGNSADNPPSSGQQNVSADGWPVLEGDTVTIINAFSGDSTLPHGHSAELFKSLVEEHSNGKILVKNYENNSLGDDATVTESVQTGDVTMAMAVTSVLGNFVPEMAVFDMPMALTDIDGAYALLKDSQFRDILNTACETNGFKLLGMLPTSFRETSSNKAVRSFDDFNGLRIRTLDNKYHRAFWNAIGTSPTTVAFSELYMALEQGVVDAQENPLSTIYTSKFYEQQDYIIKTNHIMFTLCYYTNNNWWNSLDANYQQCILMAMEQALDGTVDFAKEVEENSIAALEAEGVEIVELDDATIEQMKSAASAAYDLVRADLGDEIVDALLDGIQ